MGQITMNRLCAQSLWRGLSASGELYTESDKMRAVRASGVQHTAGTIQTRTRFFDVGKQTYFEFIFPNVSAGWDFRSHKMF